MIDKDEKLTARAPHPNIHCKDCVYNLGKGTRGDCEMFLIMKPDSIYFDGEECPLYLNNKSAE